MEFKITAKAARVNAGFSQKEIASLWDIDVSTLRRYENGLTFPPWDIVEKMEETYGITRDHLFFKRKIALNSEKAS